MSRIVVFIIIIIAGFLTTFTIILSKPNKTFAKYELKLIKTFPSLPQTQIYIEDIDNDGFSEIIHHNNINVPDHSLDIRKNNLLLNTFIFSEKEEIISKNIAFADLDGNNIKELIYVSVADKKIFLNIVKFNPANSWHQTSEKIMVDTCTHYADLHDVKNYSVLIHQNAVYFDLQAGYTVQPRNVYKYSFSEKQIIKTKPGSIVNTGLQVVSQAGGTYILSSKNSASGNTLSPDLYRQYLESENSDSVKIAQAKENQIYEYGDFSSYILLYNSNLDFAFEPVEFKGWTNITLSEIITRNKQPHIAALTFSQTENDTIRNVTICNLKGEIVKQTKAPKDVFVIFSSENTLCLGSKTGLYVFNNELEQVKTLENISFPVGFFDINQNGEPEFIAFRNNLLLVYSKNFEELTSFEIPHEFLPYPINRNIKILPQNDVADFSFNTKNYSYLFAFVRNKYSALKYPFFFMVFIFWLVLIYTLLHFNNKRLEKEKQKLEELIEERTFQLHASNEELKAQKEEILAQAEKLELQNSHLEKLNRFKKQLTATLVHDLKNPLSQIIFKTKDEVVKNLSDRTLRLVNNLLDVDKYQETELVIAEAEFDFNELLQNLEKRFRINLSEKNIRLVLPENKTVLFAEKQLIERVLENLLSNAIRFSYQNKPIKISVFPEKENLLKIGVKNFGKSIPEHQLPLIFDRYKHFDTTTTNRYISTGLGLSFCKMVIEAHGHTINAQNIDNAVLFEFTINGKIISEKEKHTQQDEQLILLPHEIEFLKPYLEPLLSVNIYNISKVTNLLNAVPDISENITSFKNKLLNAAYSSNKELFESVIARASL